MRLLLGPPGSAKTTRILNEIRDRLRSGRDDFRLLTPTATMAVHLRNQLAREGFIFRGSLVETLYSFAARHLDTPKPASTSSLSLALDEFLAAHCPEPFQAVSEYPGFRNAVARVLEELSAAGCDSLELAALEQLGSFRGPVPHALRQTMEGLETILSGRGEALRPVQIAALASKFRTQPPPGLSAIYLDGFFTFARAELELVKSLSAHLPVTVSLPEWPGALDVVGALTTAGFRVERPHPVRSRPRETLVAAPTRERESDEIARRILSLAAAGRPWREMGVVLRHAEPYSSLLAASFARFGVPARFYFQHSLDSQPAVRCLSALVEAAISGWDHAATLDALRHPASRASACAAWPVFEAAARERLPAAGLASLEQLNPDPLIGSTLAALRELDFLSAALPADCSARCASLIPLVLDPPPDTPLTPQEFLLWRHRAAGARGFVAALDETAQLLPPVPLTPAAFWRSARDVIALASFTDRDGPRDAVHVLDVYEARQWELPVVFLCGLLEGDFPARPHADALLGDDIRTRLRAAGLSLLPSSERQKEEAFLFDLACTRATSELVLSWPQYDDKGEATLRSFALDRFSIQPVTPPRIRRRPDAETLTPPAARLFDPQLLDELARQYETQRPTALESFLQCPFQFFGRYTLQLEALPGGVAERLDPLSLGTFAHNLLDAWHKQGGDLEALFERRWTAFLGKVRAPAGWRPELERARLLRGIRRFAANPRFQEGWQVQSEFPFELALEGVKLKGRIDRFDRSPAGQAIVFDFKLSGDSSVDKGVKKNDEGVHVQAGLYALALQRQGLSVEGVYFVPLRGKAQPKGWNDPGEIQSLVTLARSSAEQSQSQILTGVIAPHPADADLCQYCDFRDACRITTAVEALPATS
jgi:ATP-dependent helicase/DNAse subunit B